MARPSDSTASHASLRRLLPAVAAMLLALAASSAHADSSLELSTGAEYSHGDYGTGVLADVLLVPVSARLRWNAWALRATVPYVSINGPANFVVTEGDGDGGSGSGGGGSEIEGSDAVPVASRRQVSGLGDAVLSLTRSFNRIADTPVYAELIGRIKLASGRESEGLGTGTTDYAALSELGYAIHEGSLYLRGGRRFLGSSASIQRRDGWQLGGGARYALTDTVGIGAAYNWRQSSIVGGTPVRSVEGNADVALGRAWRLALFASAGLSSATADYTGGAALVWLIPFSAP